MLPVPWKLTRHFLNVLGVQTEGERDEMYIMRVPME